MSQIHGIVKPISNQESLQVPRYHKSAIIVPCTLTEELIRVGAARSGDTSGGRQRSVDYFARHHPNRLS
jgi:hypothetical protein